MDRRKCLRVSKMSALAAGEGFQNENTSSKRLRMTEWRARFGLREKIRCEQLNDL